MARQRFPVLQPDPTMLRFTTGLTNGSRRPVRLIAFGVSFLESPTFFLSWTWTTCFGCDDGLRAFAALALGTEVLAAALAACGAADVCEAGAVFRLPALGA